MTLLIDNMQQHMPVDEALEQFLEGVVLRAAGFLTLPVPVEVSLMLTDDQQIRELNQTYRGMDKATDVLSFPLLSLNPAARETWIANLDAQRDPDSKEAVLGDIVISVERAQLQAVEYNHSFQRELGFLMVHGLLHLLGYDHEGDGAAAREMRRLEEDILAALELSRE